MLLRAAQVIENSRNRLRPGSLSGSFPLEGKKCYFAHAQNNNWFGGLVLGRSANNMDIDPEAMKSTILARLPVHARWMVNGTPLDYDFSASQRGLHAPPDDIAEGNPEWRDFLIFGGLDYAEGGGAAPWLCVRKSQGAVLGLDLERKNAVFSLNSSLESFVRTFSFLHSYLGVGKQLPVDVERTLRDIDPGSYPASDWRLLVDCLTVAR